MLQFAGLAAGLALGHAGCNGGSEPTLGIRGAAGSGATGGSAGAAGAGGTGAGGSAGAGAGGSGAQCNNDGIVAVGEPCDDANLCPYDGCDACALEMSTVMTQSQLAAEAGIDIDNADGDDNVYTGVDNAIGKQQQLAE